MEKEIQTPLCLYTALARIRDAISKGDRTPFVISYYEQIVSFLKTLMPIGKLLLPLLIPYNLSFKFYFLLMKSTVTKKRWKRKRYDLLVYPNIFLT